MCLSYAGPYGNPKGGKEFTENSYIRFGPVTGFNILLFHEWMLIGYTYIINNILQVLVNLDY